MSIIHLIALVLIHLLCKNCYSLDSYRKISRSTHLSFINTLTPPNSLHQDYSIFGFHEFNRYRKNNFTRFSSPPKQHTNRKDPKPVANQKYVLVHSDNYSKGLNHYNNLFSNETPVSIEEDEDEEEDRDYTGEVFDDSDELPNNYKFFDYFVQKFDETKNELKLNWRHPMPCAVSQMTALQCVGELMPPSLISQCFEITDDTKLDDIISTKLGPYYNTLNYDLFFKYQKDFYFEMDKGDVVKKEIDPLMLDKPDEFPEMEADKPHPSVPLGWRTFAVLGLYDSPSPKDDPSLYWCSRPLTDGDPPPRIASGLFKYGEFFNFIASRDALAQNDTLLYSKDPIAPGEHFKGDKGDMSIIMTDPPDEYRTINKDVYMHRISEDGVWCKKHFENIVGSLNLLQALWARLSTTMLNSTAKVLKLYQLKTRKVYTKEIFSVENKLDVTEYYKNKKKGPVEFNVGLLYFVAAPTLHHAVNLVCSDPVARSNLYKNLLIFEADDALKDKLTARRTTDQKNPRQYVILGRYSRDEPINLLNDRMTRFLIRSNCVKSYFELRSPRKDNLSDFNMPLEQLLPFKQYLKQMLKDSRIRNACLNVNTSSPIGDLSIINKFEFDEALDWAHRNPYTRAGCYDSLFVAMADEVGFYGQNCKFVLPVPRAETLIPQGQEYVTVNKDPIKVLLGRMKQHSGHILALPQNVHKYIRKNKLGLHNAKRDLKNREERLRITVKKTVPNNYTSESISKAFSAASKKENEWEIQNKGQYSVLLPGSKVTVTRCKICDVQTIPARPITIDYLTNLLEQNAPKELDKPFYAKFLKDYIYVSLPEGHLLEPHYNYDNKRFNSGEPSEFDSNVGAEEMLMTDKYKVKPIPGFWIKKNDFYIFKNMDHLIIAINKDGKNKEIDPRLLRNILLQDEVYMDMVRRGGATERLDTSRSYTRYEDVLVSHLTPEEKIKMAYTVHPLNQPTAKFTQDDDLPYSRFYEKPKFYGPRDPRTMMRYYPYELYQIHLDFMDKLDRGHASIDDDPLKIMVEADYEPDPGRNSIATWEEPDKNLLEHSQDTPPKPQLPTNK